MNSHIQDCIELTDYAARWWASPASSAPWRCHPRPDLTGYDEIWDITLPEEETTIRVCDDDGQITVYLFTGPAQIESGRMTFLHNLAAPTYVAMVIDQLVADYMPPA